MKKSRSLQAFMSIIVVSSILFLLLVLMSTIFSVKIEPSPSKYILFAVSGACYGIGQFVIRKYNSLGVFLRLFSVLILIVAMVYYF